MHLHHDLMTVFWRGVFAFPRQHLFLVFAMCFGANTEYLIVYSHLMYIDQTAMIDVIQIIPHY